MAAQLEPAAHRLRLPVCGHHQRAAAVAHADILPPRERAARVPADRIAARDAHVHRRQARNRGEIDAHRAGNRRELTAPLSARADGAQKKRQQQSQQQRRKPFRLYHCHEESLGVVFAAPVSQKRETRNQRHCITFSPGLTIVFPWQSLSARNACRICAFLRAKMEEIVGGTTYHEKSRRY